MVDFKNLLQKYYNYMKLNKNYICSPRSRQIKIVVPFRLWIIRIINRLALQDSIAIWDLKRRTWFMQASLIKRRLWSGINRPRLGDIQVRSIRFPRINVFELSYHTHWTSLNQRSKLQSLTKRLHLGKVVGLRSQRLCWETQSRSQAQMPIAWTQWMKWLETRAKERLSNLTGTNTKRDI